MKQRYCITFAGVPGSSKSPIAHHLGWNLGLPVVNNDTIRTEVREDLGKFDDAEYEARRDERIRELLKSGRSFIYDASIDRFWESRNRELIAAGYKTFVISLDLSRGLIDTLYEVKGYTEYEPLDGYMRDHEKFLETYGDAINLHIDDAKFHDRLNLSLDAVRSWIS